MEELELAIEAEWVNVEEAVKLRDPDTAKRLLDLIEAMKAAQCRIAYLLRTVKAE